jgi:putative glutamine amidotransferase
MRVVQAIGYDEPRDALSHDWIDWTERHGWTPLPLSNYLKDPARYLKEMKVGAIVLTGGNDAVPRDGVPSDHCPNRNCTERMALDWAIANGVPVLAVCRGLHIVNIHFGGAVIPDIGSLKAAHVARNHKLEILNSLGGILGTPDLETNSFHEQGIAKDGLADALRPFITSGDGLIEGVVHPEFPILAVQWHPERDNPAAHFDDIAVSRLFSEGVFWRAG